MSYKYVGALIAELIQKPPRPCRVTWTLTRWQFCALDSECLPDAAHACTLLCGSDSDSNCLRYVQIQ